MTAFPDATSDFWRSLAAELDRLAPLDRPAVLDTDALRKTAASAPPRRVEPPASPPPMQPSGEIGFSGLWDDAHRLFERYAQAEQITGERLERLRLRLASLTETQLRRLVGLMRHELYPHRRRAEAAFAERRA